MNIQDWFNHYFVDTGYGYNPVNTTVYAILLIIFAYIIYNIFYMVFSYPAGILADRIGFKKVLLISFLIFAAVYAGFGMTSDPNMVWLLFAVYGFYIAFNEGVSKAYISNIAPKEKIGTAIGLYYTATGVAVLFASLVAGWLWSAFGAPSAFYYGSITALTASILFAGLCSWQKREKRSQKLPVFPAEPH